MARKKEVQAEQAEVSSNKDKVNTIKDNLNKFFKKRVITTQADDDDDTIHRQSTGILSLDIILGRGSNGCGWPVGRVSEIYGPESSGKSSVVISTIAEAQKEGKIAALIDAEHALNFAYAKKLGVNVEEMLHCQPDTAEEGFQVAINLAESGQVGLIVLDSMPFFVPEREAENDMESNQMGLQASLNSKFLKKITPIASKNNVTIILVNHLTSSMSSYGPSEVTGGGKKIRQAANIRLEIRRSEHVEDNGDIIGHIIKCKTVKNKTAAPQKVTEIRIDYGIGFNNEFCLVNQGVLKGVVVKSGAWYKLFDKQYQGREALISALQDDKELSDRLKAEILGYTMTAKSMV